MGIALVRPDDEVVLITDRGQTIRTRVDGIRETGRNAQGVRVMNVDEDERVVALETVGENVEPADSLAPPAADGEDSAVEIPPLGVLDLSQEEDLVEEGDRTAADDINEDDEGGNAQGRKPDQES